MTKLAYMSIVDHGRPEGQKWIGGMYIEASSVEILVIDDLPAIATEHVPPSHRNRILSKKELAECSPDGQLVDGEGNPVAV